MCLYCYLLYVREILTHIDISKNPNISFEIVAPEVSSILRAKILQLNFLPLYWILYTYKGVEVPPLGMVDDILTISKCSKQATVMNATVNSFVETKKLKLKRSKCSVVHVGRVRSCPDLKIHMEEMHKENSAVYLGDTFQKKWEK